MIRLAVGKNKNGVTDRLISIVNLGKKKSKNRVLVTKVAVTEQISDLDWWFS